MTPLIRPYPVLEWAADQAMVVSLKPLTLATGRTLSDFSGYTLTIRRDPSWPREGHDVARAADADPVGDGWPVAEAATGVVIDGVVTFTFDTPAEAGRKRYARGRGRRAARAGDLAHGAAAGDVIGNVDCAGSEDRLGLWGAMNDSTQTGVAMAAIAAVCTIAGSAFQWLRDRDKLKYDKRITEQDAQIGLLTKQNESQAKEMTQQASELASLKVSHKDCEDKHAATERELAEQRRTTELRLADIERQLNAKKDRTDQHKPLKG